MTLSKGGFTTMTYWPNNSKPNSHNWNNSIEGLEYNLLEKVTSPKDNNAEGGGKQVVGPAIINNIIKKQVVDPAIIKKIM